MVETNETPVHTYHNFSKYNEAVDLELSRHDEARRVLKSKSVLLRAKALAFVILAFCVVLLTIFIIYSLFRDESRASVSQVPGSSTVEDTRKTKQQLTEIASGSENNNESFPIEKKFTVVSSTTMITGEKVVTAEEFLPDNLKSPNWVYCYVSNSNGTSQNAEYLASYKDGEMTIETVDKYLLENAMPLCNFPAVSP